MTPEPPDRGKLQAALYEFPYHYVPRFEGRSFRQSRHWAYGLSYLGALELITQELRSLDRPPGTLCDVGCGDGALLYHLRQRLDCELVGVDVDRRALTWARLFSPDVDFLPRDIVREPLDRRFDVVTLIEVLEHVPPPELPAFLAAACGLLRGGGTAIITVPHTNVPVSRKHFQHFTCSGLRSLLAPHGTRLNLTPFDRIGPLEQLYEKYLMRGGLVVDSSHLNALRWRLYRRSGGLGAPTEKGCRRILAVLQR